jgi:hypothetical protein
LPAIYIACIIKYIVTKIDALATENETTNNNEDTSSEWLEQYWFEQNAENLPETSSSQEERSPKKAKSLASF